MYIPSALVLPIVQMHKGASVVAEQRRTEIIGSKFHWDSAKHLTALVRHSLQKYVRVTK